MNAAVGAEAETTNAERAGATIAPTEAAGSDAVDATAGSRAKAARLGADRATTAVTAPSSAAAPGTAVTIGADTGTGANPTAAAPKGGRSGGIAATTHPGATRATDHGTTVARTVAAANGVTADRPRARTGADTAGLAIETIGAVETGANGEPRGRIGADTAGRAIGTSGVDPTIGAATTTQPVHRSVVAAAVVSAVSATGIFVIRDPVPAAAATSATAPVGSGGPAINHRAMTVLAVAMTATAVRTKADSDVPRTTLVADVTTGPAAEMIATAPTRAASGALRKSLVADAMIGLVVGTTVTGVRTRAASGVPLMTLVVAATTVGDPTRAVSVAATAGGRVRRVTVPAASAAQEAIPAA
ncbi:hypothetical protein [Nocardia cyriacigeorgica]|uniref:hypothetical protein n=1 Tax=Nocardia cyriacigeorgica TaxID=135487 RepID=UPI00189442E9|nr:hypothetical protein [Nocardia cyriacigeorgica]MBF6416445.1 hypothetical protein [Nocardia cyriacigeorgica]